MKNCAVVVGGLVLSLGIIGCGVKQHPKAPVSGKVTYKGGPVTTGRVVFINATGQDGFGDIGPDGGYKLEAPIGECKVAITSREKEPGPDSKTAKQVRPGMWVGKSFIPEKYENHMGSGLTFTVEQGQNTANFDLKE